MARRIPRPCQLYISAGLIAFLTMAAVGVCAVQEAEKPSRLSAQTAEIHDLLLSETIPFLSTPPTTIMLTATKCDSKGNIYSVQSTASLTLDSAGLSGIPVSKLLLDSKLVLPYPVPSIDHYRGVIRTDFDVTPDGNLYSLLQGIDASSERTKVSPSSFVAKYRGEGSLDSYVKLGDTPSGRIQPFRLAVFKNGNVLVAGTVVNEGQPLRPFVAAFDGFGRFIKYVQISGNRGTVQTVSDAAKFPANRQVTGESETSKSGGENAIDLLSTSFMVSAPDGNVYLLRNAAHPSLYAVSPYGEVIQEFDVAPPEVGLTASNMALVGDYGVFISFVRLEGSAGPQADQDGPRRLLSVINTHTGEVGAVYRLPPDGFNVPVCATSSDNFLFLGATDDQQHQQVARYIAR